MGAHFSIKVVAVAMEVGETAREKERRKGGQERGPKKHQHLREQTKDENQKNKKTCQENGRATKREGRLGSRRKRLFQEKSALLNQMLRRLSPVR